MRNEITFLKKNRVTLNQVSKELTYRENASSNCKWDDRLYCYTTEELEKIEKLWQGGESKYAN